jgi:uncharacterized protein YjiS (DUF1127 family)
MSYVFHSGRATSASTGFARRLAARLHASLRALSRELAGAWSYAAARREFERLDDSTLRDLGISRSEFDSYWAETHGLAEPTRVRVTQDRPGSGS